MRCRPSASATSTSRSRPRRSGVRSLPGGWNDGQENVRRPPRTAMDRDLLAEDLRRTVARIAVLERPDTGEDRAERPQPRRRPAGILVVASAHGEADPVARRRHDRGRPDLDVQLVHLPGDEWLLL